MNACFLAMEMLDVEKLSPDNLSAILVKWSFAPSAQRQVMEFVDDVKRGCGLGERDIMAKAKVSPHTLRNAREGKPIDVAALRRTASAATGLRDRYLKSRSKTEQLLTWANRSAIRLFMGPCSTMSTRDAAASCGGISSFGNAQMASTGT